MTAWYAGRVIGDDLTRDWPLGPFGPLVSLDRVGQSRETREKYTGQKSLRLAELRRQAFPVPPGFVLGAKTFLAFVEEHLPSGHDVASLTKLVGADAFADRAARARDRIFDSPLPPDLISGIDVLWEEIEPMCPWGLAIRSSATCEDTRGHSLAGLAHSALGVRGGDAIAMAIREVWASLFLPRTLVYLQRWGLGKATMAVILQRMVVADVSGVLFSTPPVGLTDTEKWSERDRIVSVTLGLGAPVVDGGTVADLVTIDPSGAVKSEVVADKATYLAVGAAGLEDRVTSAARRNAPALDREMTSRLSLLVARLEDRGHASFDVEFAFEAAETPIPWLLQLRPLTGGSFPEGGDQDTVWSRANVGEALPGAATPLTWSVARRFAQEGFVSAFSALGCSVPKGAPLVANVHGRFYLNLSAFMTIAAQVPGLTPARLLGLSGGADEAAIEALQRAMPSPSYARLLSRAPFTLPRALTRHVGLEREVAAFEADVSKDVRRMRESDLQLYPDDALASSLKRALELLSRTGELMLTCASASLASHLTLTALLGRVVKKLDARGHGDAPTSPASAEREGGKIARALTGGISDVESANPGIRLMAVARIARTDSEALAVMQERTITSLDELPSGPTRAALLEYLESFGDRAVREAELATARWEEDPAPLLAMLTSAVRIDLSDADAGPARARALADAEMARIEGTLSFAEVAVVRFLVSRSQRFTRLREQMRTWVTRVLGIIRRIALDIDLRLRRIDPSVGEGGVFFCTSDELIRALSSGRPELGHITRLRRAEYARDLARPDPPSTFVGRPTRPRAPPATTGALRGLPGSPGVVEGRARLLTRGTEFFDELEPGDILVSRTTDVGLSPLFLLAAGVVTELGGPLSHAAIVAREYGVPAVVNVEHATSRIRTGDRLRIDGDRGTVELLKADR